MSEIIVGVDASARSEDAVAFARRIADSTGAAVTLATSFRHEDESEQADQTLGRMRALLSERTRVTTHAIADSSPPRALHALAERDDAALVVVGSSHRGRLGQVLTGSTADRLLHGSPCPVAVAPQGYASADRPPIRTIGVAHNGSDEAEAALSGAIEAAQRLGATLRVIRVFDATVSPSAHRSGSGYVSAEDNLQRMEREQLEATVARVPEDVHPEAVFRGGDAADVLASQSYELDLLILGSRGYGPRCAVVLGGVSHKVLREAHCPVIVLPRGEHTGLEALFVREQEAQPS